jgi:hypothetical protein
MGFNKRFLNKKSLTQVYNARGAEGVIIYITRADATLCEDKFSSRVAELAAENNTAEIIKLFTDEQSGQ